MGGLAADVHELKDRHLLANVCVCARMCVAFDDYTLRESRT